MTGSFSKSRNGSRYPYYYHCNHSGHQRISADIANQKFVQLLNSFVPVDNVLELFSLVVDDLKHAAKHDITKQLKSLGEEIAGLNKKIDEADDMLMSKEIDKETHKRIVSRHSQCISELMDKQKFLKDSGYESHTREDEPYEKCTYQFGELFQ